MSRLWKRGDKLVHTKTGAFAIVRLIYTDSKPHVALLDRFPDELCSVDWWEQAGWRLVDNVGADGEGQS